MKRIITFGTYDLFHIGHLRILERAKQEGDYLIVGVSSDELNEKKGKKAVFPTSERVEIIKSLRCIDEVFIEDSLELKDEYIKTYKADLLVMGDDWKGKFDWVSCPVKYLERTPNISTTYLKNSIAMVYKE
jgi:glycerol-3-phosphate cytidylyltransferase